MTFAKYYANDDEFTAPWLNPYLTQQIKKRNQIKQLGIINQQSINNGNNNQKFSQIKDTRILAKKEILQDNQDLCAKQGCYEWNSVSKLLDTNYTDDEGIIKSGTSLQSETSSTEETSMTSHLTSTASHISSGDNEYSFTSSTNVSQELDNVELKGTHLISHLSLTSTETSTETPGESKTKSNIDKKLCISSLVDDVKSKLTCMFLRTGHGETEIWSRYVLPSNLRNKARIRRRVRKYKQISVELGAREQGVQMETARCCDHCERYQLCLSGILKCSEETVNTVEGLLKCGKCL